MEDFEYSSKFSGAPLIGGAFAKSDTESIPLSYGYPYPDTFPINELIKASEEALSMDGGSVLQYTGGAGKVNLVEWIKERVKLSNIEVDKENVLVTSGSNQAIDLITRALTNPGDNIWIESPTFFGALRFFHLAEVNVTSFSLDEDGVLVDDIEAALKKARENDTPIPKFLYVIANHHNPEGVSLSVERRKKLAELAYEYNFFIIEDDAYGELTFDAERKPSIYSFGPERVIYIGSFSKIFGPGLRLGWAVASKEALQKLQTLKSDGSTSVFVQEIISRMLNNFDIESHIDRLKGFYQKRRDLMIEALVENFGTDVTYNIPQGGFFIWVTFPKHVKTKLILDEAIHKYNVDFFASDQFYVGETESNHIRLSFTYCEEPQISKGVSAIAKTYKNLYS